MLKPSVISIALLFQLSLKLLIESNGTNILHMLSENVHIKFNKYWAIWRP